MNSKLGNKIHHHRKERGYSLDRLSKITGISKSYIWELEKSYRHRDPSARKIVKIADALGVTIDYLLDELILRVAK